MLPGYAIGGLAGGEDKTSFWRVVAHVSLIAFTSGKCLVELVLRYLIMNVSICM